MQDEKLGNSSDERKAHYLFESSSDVNHCKPVSDSKPIRPVSYSKPVQERILQCAVCNVYKFFSKHSPDYFEELFFLTEETPIQTRSSFQKLKIPRRKTNIGLKSLSYTGPSLWNNLNENLKRSSSINDFKHKIK